VKCSEKISFGHNSEFFTLHTKWWSVTTVLALIGGIELEVAPHEVVLLARDGDADRVFRDAIGDLADIVLLIVLLRLLLVDHAYVIMSGRRRRPLCRRVRGRRLGRHGRWLLVITETCLLETLVDVKDKVADAVNLVWPIVADVGHTVHKKNHIGDVFDGGDGVLGFFHHIHITIHAHHAKLAAVYNRWELLEFRNQCAAKCALLAVEHDQCQALPARHAQHIALLSGPYTKVVISKK